MDKISDTHIIVLVARFFRFFLFYVGFPYKGKKKQLKKYSVEIDKVKYNTKNTIFKLGYLRKNLSSKKNSKEKSDLLTLSFLNS